MGPATLRWWSWLTTSREQRKIRSAFSRYLKPEMVAELARNPEPLNIGLRSNQLFGLLIQVRDDIPEDVQRHVEKVVPIGLKHHGTIVDQMASILLIAFGMKFPYDGSDEENRQRSRAASEELLAALGGHARIVAFCRRDILRKRG
jgi:hypothetical protein